MAIYLYAMNQAGQSLHLHPGCNGSTDHPDAPDHLAFNHVGEVYAAMRASRTASRYDEGKGRYVRNRIHYFTISGDVPSQDFIREQVDALPVCRSHPDHPDYGLWRADIIEAAPWGRKTVTEAGMMSPAMARSLRLKGVHLWDTDRPTIQPNPDRVNDTTTAHLTTRSDNDSGEPVYVRTLPDRHPVHPGTTTRDVFAHEGYWFTIPEDFPASVPAEHHKEGRTTYAVLREDIGAGLVRWSVMETDRRTAPVAVSTESRRTAVRHAVAKVANARDRQAVPDQAELGFAAH
ncbi:hypothetical protein [Streptomyces sp. NPDC002215]|uniref:hypothetical protein n=1 Tax=Streptomyces sp. NPDC002215 TaxID=3154412 RepID=UPI0033198121